MTETSHRTWRQNVNQQPKQAPFRDHACELVEYHAPTPSVVEFHHSKPVMLQNRLYGHIQYPADTWLCSNCHDSVHEWIYWRLGMRRNMPHVGRAAKAEAERTLAWYNDERLRLGLPLRFTVEGDEESGD